MWNFTAKLSSDISSLKVNEVLKWRWRKIVDIWAYEGYTPQLQCQIDILTEKSKWHNSRVYKFGPNFGSRKPIFLCNWKVLQQLSISKGLSLWSYYLVGGKHWKTSVGGKCIFPLFLGRFQMLSFNSFFLWVSAHDVIIFVVGNCLFFGEKIVVWKNATHGIVF